MEKYTEAERRAADLQEQAIRRSEEKPQARPSQQAARETSQSKLFLFQFLDLVDRYWNGSKSLHKNVKFKGKSMIIRPNFLNSDFPNPNLGPNMAIISLAFVLNSFANSGTVFCQAMSKLGTMSHHL